MSDQREDTQVFADPAAVAAGVAHRLLDRLTRIQREGREPQLVLTGGSIARQIHREVARLSPGSPVDWGHVRIWWGDERFVAADDEQRNAAQAQADLLDHIPVDPLRVHPMPAADDPAFGGDLDAAATAYGNAVRDHGTDVFDVLMLGLGPDGHCASLFPRHPALDTTDRVAVAVRASPKPPPERISLTFPTLDRNRAVWFVATGAAKADAVAAARTGGDHHEVPARRIRGGEELVWFLDEAAVGH